MLTALLVASPLAAQTTLATSGQGSTSLAGPSDEPPAVGLRVFGMATGQEFSARKTFDAAFGHAFEPFWGGGGQIVLRNGTYVEVDLSRFKQNGQRAFLFNNQVFRVGIPLTATETPIEFSGGYRLRRWQRVVPYAAGGIGSYGYQEQSSGAAAGENLNRRHAGYLVTGGVEVRLSRWLGLGTDVEYTRVPGIFGGGGLSQQAHENSLGGTAARIKFLVGR